MLSQIEQLKSIIKNRVCFVCLQGRSIEALETEIVKYKDKDICYTALGLFTSIENFILNKIDKKLDIVFDCASAPHARIPHFETFVRLPRLEEFLARSDNNVWITTHGIIRDCINALNRTDIIDKYVHKIVQIDTLFPSHHEYMEVPNSVTLLVAALIAGQARKIILFGCDGYTGDLGTGYLSYYKPELVMKERQAAIGSIEDSGINRDTDNFERMFPTFLDKYRKLFNNYCEIVNCSSSSMYTCIKKINYNELEQEINETYSSDSRSGH